MSPAGYLMNSQLGVGTYPRPLVYADIKASEMPSAIQGQDEDQVRPPDRPTRQRRPNPRIRHRPSGS